MIHKRDLVPVMRKPNVAHVAAGGVKHLADRELETELLVNVTRNRQARAIGSPVRVQDAVQNFAGRATRKWNARQHSCHQMCGHELTIERDSQLSGWRYRQQVGI